ncbi:MAG TPA: HDOD domain-containing protein [Planctomycetes bacterium]|nr:HDOD domain-containing protein [Planctomycetota bacterium]
MRKLTSEEVERALAAEEIISACPAVVAHITETASRTETTARDLAKIIATDEALSAKVLKVVNSAFYGMPGEISTVTQAAIILGLREIMSLVYSVPVGNVFGGSKADDMVAVWEHSVLTGIIAREICYLVKYPLPEEIFIAGVIHDVGRPVIYKILGEQYTILAEETRARKLDLEDAERALIGIPHTEAGARLLDAWRFPGVLREAVAFHHRPVADDGLKKVAAMVYVGDKLADTPPDASFGAVLSGMLAEVVQSLGLTRRSIAEAYSRAGAAFEEVRGSFQL